MLLVASSKNELTIMYTYTSTCTCILVVKELYLLHKQDAG